MGFHKIRVFPKQVMRKVMALHHTAFVKRVRRGLDAEGHTFKSYSKSYIEYKSTRFKSKRTGKRIPSMAGKSIESTRTHPPDLTVTGRMLTNLKQKKYTKDMWQLGWTGEDAQKVGYNEDNGRDITSDIPNFEKKILTKQLAKEMEKQFRVKLKDVNITIGK